MFQGGRFKLHHDNAPVHTARIVLEFLRKKGVEMIPHPPYSPDLASNDFFFPTLKRSVKGWRFSSTNEIETAVQGGLQRTSKDGFEEVFEQWQKRWDKCVRLGGEYIKRVRSRGIKNRFSIFCEFCLTLFEPALVYLLIVTYLLIYHQEVMLPIHP